MDVVWCILDMKGLGSVGQGMGRLGAGLTMDGVLVRDLQLRPSSKFAFLLRPLPARAAQLDSYATTFRRRILRVVPFSKARKRCGETLSSCLVNIVF